MVVSKLEQFQFLADHRLHKHKIAIHINSLVAVTENM